MPLLWRDVGDVGDHRAADGGAAIATSNAPWCRVPSPLRSPGVNLEDPGGGVIDGALVIVTIPLHHEGFHGLDLEVRGDQDGVVQLRGQDWVQELLAEPGQVLDGVGSLGDAGFVPLYVLPVILGVVQDIERTITLGGCFPWAFKVGEEAQVGPLAVPSGLEGLDPRMRWRLHKRCMQEPPDCVVISGKRRPMTQKLVH